MAEQHMFRLAAPTQRVGVRVLEQQQRVRDDVSSPRFGYPSLKIPGITVVEGAQSGDEQGIVHPYLYDTPKPPRGMTHEMFSYGQIMRQAPHSMQFSYETTVFRFSSSQ
jgi:hypothetical protein